MFSALIFLCAFAIVYGDGGIQVTEHVNATFDLLFKTDIKNKVSCTFGTNVRAFSLVASGRYKYLYEVPIDKRSYELDPAKSVYSPPYFVGLRIRGDVGEVNCNSKYVRVHVEVPFYSKADYQADPYAVGVEWVGMPDNGYPLVSAVQYPNTCDNIGGGESRAFKLVHVDGNGHVKADFRYATHESDANVRITIPGLHLGMSAQGTGWRTTVGFSEFGYIASEAAWYAVNRDGGKKFIPCTYQGEVAIVANSISETAPLGVYSVKRDGRRYGQVCPSDNRCV